MKYLWICLVILLNLSLIKTSFADIVRTTQADSEIIQLESLENKIKEGKEYLSALQKELRSIIEESRGNVIIKCGDFWYDRMSDDMGADYGGPATQRCKKTWRYIYLGGHYIRTKNSYEHKWGYEVCEKHLKKLPRKLRKQYKKWR